jgi:FMN phosphatase YigB (HAD superfamily)
MSALISYIQTYIKKHNIKVVSFDLFDTLIFRHVSKPTDVFALAYAKVEDELALGFNSKEFEELRVFAEREAKQKSLANEVTLEEIYNYLPFSPSITRILLNSELETEASIGFLYEPMLELINSLVEQGLQVLFLSDMYLNKEQIRHCFLSKSKVASEIPLYISSECRTNKSSGFLFKHVRERLESDYNSWLHVGDNAVSDVQNPKLLGLHAIHASAQLNLSQILKTEHSCTASNPSFNAVRFIAATHSVNEFDSISERSAFDIGAFVWGPALHSFSDWVINKTINAKSRTILCLMREAEVYVPLIEMRLAQRNITHIVVKKLFASRKSTFWPSIDISEDDWLDEVIGILVRRRGYTVADFYRDFQLEHDDLHKEFNANFFKYADGLFYQGGNVLKCLTALANNHSESVKSYIKQQRARFVNYYESHISTPYQECTVVDFGNGGTIHNHIQRILGQHSAGNLLFYSSERVYRYTQETAFHSFIDAQNDIGNFRLLLTRSPECIELFLVGDCGTTLGYADDNAGTPILADKLILNSPFVNAFMLGAIEYFRTHDKLGFSFIEPSDSVGLLLRFIQFPTTSESSLYTHIYHQDNFGSNDVYPVISNEQVDDVKALGLENVFLEFSRYTKWKFTHIHWPQAILNLISDKFMQKNHGLLAMDTDNDVSDLAERIISKGWSTYSVYGAGVFFEKLLPYLDKTQAQVEMLIDRKAEISGPYEFMGYQVVSLNQALETNCKNIVICSVAFKEEIAQNIFEQSQKHNCAVINVLSL